MGCCIGNTLNKLQSLQARLEKKGQTREAARVGQLKTRIESTARRATKIQSKMTQAEGEAESKHLAGPAALDKYYEECKKNPPEAAKGKVEEYCARVAWSIFCSHVDPSHPSCTSKGKDLKK